MMIRIDEKFLTYLDLVFVEFTLQGELVEGTSAFEAADVHDGN